MERPGTTPSKRSLWDRYFEEVSNEAWLAAMALLECDPHRVVLSDAERWITWSATDDRAGESGYPARHLELDWEAWVADVEGEGRAWCGSEQRWFEVVAALATRRPVRLAGVLDSVGSWEADVWRVLIEWGTGGDNRGRPGRSTSIRRRQPG